MKRIPVTKESYMQKFNTGKSTARTGKINKKAAMGAVNFGWNLTSGIGSINTSAYNTSYANMGMATGSFGDVPMYFALMNANNGGILYWPVTLKEKYEWFRYFARTDPFVKRAVEFHTDLPMSKLVLRMPKMNDAKLREKILRKYENMVKKINLFDRLHSALYETNILGNAFLFCEYNDEKKSWEKIVILPPEEILISKFPMSDQAKVQYRPEILNQVINKQNVNVDSEEAYQEFIENLPSEQKAVFSNIPYDLAKQLIENDGTLVMDTDPYTGDGENKCGSFVYHFSEKRHDYYDLGTSPLECVLIPLLMKEHYKYTQLALASRNMTPRNKICAPDVSEEDLVKLREEVDMSMLNPDYSIVTNYDWSWEMIGAENRLIDLSREYQTIEEQFFAGLSVTKEILTGEGMYSGGKISVELLNTKYMFKREIMCNFVEESLFKPMAEDNGFYEEDEWGNKTYFYPKLSFTRLSIRDNAEVFDSLFQLYQKGSIPVDIILDLFNLDSDEIHEKLKQDMFTVKDAAYNDMLRSVYSSIADRVTENTDLADQMINYITGPEGKKLNLVQNQEEDSEDSGNPFGNSPEQESEDEIVEEYLKEKQEEENNSDDQPKEEMIDQYINEQNPTEIEASPEDEEVSELIAKKISNKRVNGEVQKNSQSH